MIVPQRVTDPEMGTLRRCPGCGEWWPEDREFFGTTLSPDGYRRSWCRCCKAERRARSNAKRLGTAAK